MVIDVFINQKTICSSWNSGRAIIGLQNMNRGKGICAPNRLANSASWQVLPSNPNPAPPTNVQGPEVWRFVPISNSTPLYKDVTIYDTSGNIIYTTDQAPPTQPLVPYTSSSDTVRISTDNSTFQIDFPSIPMPQIFGDYFSRPVLIDTYSWAENGADGFKKNISPFTAFFNDANMKAKLKGFSLMRCKLKLRFMVNGSPFYYGAIV